MKVIKILFNFEDLEDSNEETPNTINLNIIADNVDDLILQGIQHIKKEGEFIEARAGHAFQAYGVNYVLQGSLDRVHSLRHPISTRYFAKELLAYFKGSLSVKEGLGQASKFWNHLADNNGEINSNYGYYVFHQQIPENPEKAKTQYEWVVNLLDNNLKSRRAIININQVAHKTDTKDFPCTISMQFFTRGDLLCCEVSSRSTDVITGLPYDMGFFSLINELVYADLQQRGHAKLKLGYTVMKTTFTQIYESRNIIAHEVLDKGASGAKVVMPRINDAAVLLEDIYKGTQKSEIIRWIYANAE